MKKIGSWELDDGNISYEARIFPDGCEMVVIDEAEEQEIILAVGLEELDKAIGILQAARLKFAALPKNQQVAPAEIEDEDEEEEDEEIDEED